MRSVSHRTQGQGANTRDKLFSLTVASGETHWGAMLRTINGNSGGYVELYAIVQFYGATSKADNTSGRILQELTLSGNAGVHGIVSGLSNPLFYSSGSLKVHPNEGLSLAPTVNGAMAANAETDSGVSVYLANQNPTLILTPTLYPLPPGTRQVQIRLTSFDNSGLSTTTDHAFVAVIV